MEYDLREKSKRVSIFRKLEQWDMALEDARAAEKILTEAFGSDHPLYAYAANAEGVILLLMGRPQQPLKALSAIGILAGSPSGRGRPRPQHRIGCAASLLWGAPVPAQHPSDAGRRFLPAFDTEKAKTESSAGNSLESKDGSLASGYCLDFSLCSGVSCYGRYPSTTVSQLPGVLASQPPSIYL